MNVFRFFLKKVGENKTRLILTVAMYSFALVLVWFIFTLGINGVDYIQTWLKSDSVYKMICAESTESTVGDILEKNSAYKTAAIKNSEKYVVSFEQFEIESPLIEYDSDFDIVIPGEGLIEGDDELSSNEVLIGKSILDYYNLEYSDAIGKTLIMSDQKEYTISGVFDDTHEMSPGSCIIYDNTAVEAEKYLIMADTMDDVAEIVLNLQEKGYKVTSFEKEIADIQEYIRIASFVVFMISMLVMLCAIVILYFSLTNSIRDMYPFIAMLKAIGYKKKQCSKLIFAEIATISLFSLVVATGLYFFGMWGIGKLFTLLKVTQVQGMSIQQLLESRILVPVGGIIVALAGGFAVKACCDSKLEKMQVGEILCEENQ